MLQGGALSAEGWSNVTVLNRCAFPVALKAAYTVLPGIDDGRPCPGASRGGACDTPWSTLAPGERAMLPDLPELLWSFAAYVPGSEPRHYLSRQTAEAYLAAAGEPRSGLAGGACGGRRRAWGCAGMVGGAAVLLSAADVRCPPASWPQHNWSPPACPADDFGAYCNIEKEKECVWWAVVSASPSASAPALRLCLPYTAGRALRALPPLVLRHAVSPLTCPRAKLACLPAARPGGGRRGRWAPGAGLPRLRPRTAA